MITLTGDIQYRLKTYWFSPPILVLQVQEKVDWKVPFCDKVYKTTYRWRDAVVTDLWALGLHKEKK